MTKRANKLNPDTYAKWEFPGGKVNLGEDLPTACLRELKEETGYQGKIITMIPTSYAKTISFRNIKLHILVFAFACQVNKRGHAIDAAKILAERWIDADKIDFTECLSGVKHFLQSGKYL